MKLTLKSQRGIALPVMLLMMLTMLATSIFLIKSINSTTLMSSNLAYESSLAKQADLGLASGFQWLSATAFTSKATFNNNVASEGYVSNYDITKKVNDTAFWIGSKVVTDVPTNTQVEYVIHRMCKNGSAAYDATGNVCVLTVDAAGAAATSVAPGQSLGMGNTTFDSAPQVHYVITSRIFGARGGNVVNQLVVLIGA